jgi:hypothetical protein
LYSNQTGSTYKYIFVTQPESMVDKAGTNLRK